MEYTAKKFADLNIHELYEILRVRNEVFVVEQACIYLDLDDKDQNGYHLYYSDHGKIQAYLRILEKGQTFDEISIGRVLVTQQARGSGLARELMIKAISYITHDLNEKTIRISAQEYLLEFYLSLGFKQVSEVYLEDDIPHIEMLFNSESK